MVLIFSFKSGVKDASSLPSHSDSGRFVFQNEDPSMFTSTEPVCPVCVVNAFLVFSCATCGLSLWRVPQSEVANHCLMGGRRIGIFRDACSSR